MIQVSSQGDQHVKVLYLAGFGRSGTTILANILGQAAGLVSVGELYMMWETALERPNACGCRNIIPDCPFWNEVFGHAFGGVGALDPQQMNRILRRYVRTRHYPIRAASISQKSEPADLQLLRNHLSRLYRSIVEVSGSRVIVDTSKRPMYGRLLAQITGIELYVLHMVRDPRAVAYSWARKKPRPVTGRAAVRMGLIKSSLLWSGLNLVTEYALGRVEDGNRYLLLKYEDFASRPKSAYRAILELLEEPLKNDPFVSENRVRLATSHTMAGNSSRFADGLVDVDLDKEWETSMSVGRKVLVGALTWPLMERYHYPIFRDRTE